MCKNIFISLICFVFISYTISFADTLKYELEPHMIGSAWIAASSKEYNVVLRLVDPFCSDFAKLTKENIGRRLAISYKERILVSTRVQAEILRGTISGGSYKTLQEAEDFIREVLPGIGEIPVHGPFAPDPLELDLKPGMLQSASIEQRSFGPAVLFQILYRFSDAYHPLFADLTRGNVGRQLIIHYCNGRVIASMNIQGEIIDGVFTGGVFSTQREAEAFVHEVAPGIEVMEEH